MKKDVMGGACGRHGRDKYIKHFSRKTRREETLGKSRSRWEENIRTDLREIGGGGWYGLDSSGS
jgi:hypothetical protein